MTTNTTSKAPTLAERVRALEETVTGQQELIRYLTQALTGMTLPVAGPVTEPATEPMTRPEPPTAQRMSNPDLAAWMRGQGLVPRDSAWKAAKQDETDLAVLRQLNVNDGHAPKVNAEQQAAAELEAKKAEAQRGAEQWMQDHNLIPQGQAWDAVQQGERNVAKLRKLNKADGLTPETPAATTKSQQPRKTTASKTTASKTTPRKTAASKDAESKPKAADTATLQPRMVEPETPAPSVVDDLEPSVVAQLRADGLSYEDIALAYKLKNQG